MTYINNNRKRIIIKPRFYFFVAIFIAIIIWLVFAAVNYFEPPKVEWGRLSTDQEISAIIIRDEQLVKANEYGRFESISGEGDLVTQGDEVAILYTQNYSEDDMDTLISIRQNIKNYQEENVLHNIKRGDLINIDDEIDRLITEISELVRAGDTRILPSKERELKTMMESRRVYLNDTLYRDSTLEEKFQTEEVLYDKIQRNVMTLTSPSTGIISFFLDGMEEYLQKQSVETINNDDYTLIEDQLLNSSIKSNVSEGATVSLEQPIYRIINPSHWYAIIKMPRNKNTLVEGSTCDITFESYGQPINNVYVLDVRQYNQDVVIVLEFNCDIGAMASLRIVSGHMGSSSEGYKVSNDLIAQQNNQPGIYIKNENGDKVFVPITIQDQNYFETIFSVTNTSGQAISVGDRVIKP